MQRQAILSMSALFVLALVVTTPGTRQRASLNSDTRREGIPALIDRLQHIADAPVSYMYPELCSGFLPLFPGDTRPSCFGGPPVDASALRDLVRRGPEALPHLLRHLGDARPTKVTMRHYSSFGGMTLEDEYDYNVRTSPSQAGVNPGLTLGRGIDVHTVTVGDLCFVALGQITNRHFNAVRYQPTVCVMVNSPTASEALRLATLREWGELTPERLRASLIRDLREPDAGHRRLGACLRLGFYFPDDLESLARELLAAPHYTSATAFRFTRSALYCAHDAAERRELFRDYVSANGPVAERGLLGLLFDDLEDQVAGARECLVELFHYPAHVTGRDRPCGVPLSESELGGLISMLHFFPSRQIDRIVAGILRAATDRDLRRNCATYLVGRGFDEDIRSYLVQPGGDIGPSLSECLGWTELHRAAWLGDVAKAADLLRHGAKVNTKDQGGKTPLHVATSSRQYAVMQALLAADADPNGADALGRTPLAYAAESECDAEVALLLSRGARVSGLWEAVYADDPDRVRRLVEADRGLIGRRTWTGSGPLHVAARLGHAAAAAALIQEGAVVSDRMAGDSFTPLHFAAEYGRDAVVRLLISRGADAKARSYTGKTPAECAMARGHVEVSKLLSFDGK